VHTLPRELPACWSNYGINRMTNGKLTSGEFARYTVIAVAIIALAAVCWVASEVFVFAFGAVVLAAALRAMAAPLMDRLKMSERWAVITVIALLAVLFFGGLWAFGAQLAEQFKGLRTQLPDAVARIREWLQSTELGRTAVDSLSAAPDGGQLLGGAAKIAGATMGGLAHALLILFAGIYLALDPAAYVRGVLKLLPQHHRVEVGEALESSGTALRKWLVGQLAVMVVVGLLVGIGLSVVGVPSAVALGLIAGLCEFVPVIGPIVSAIPGLLLAALAGPQAMFYAALIYVAVQQIEGILATPIAQRWSVHVPPALTLLSVLAAGLLFGTLGVIFAMPLTVVVLVLVQKLYVRRMDERTTSHLKPTRR
jgi:predicted PurR-regulated permease PerM